MISGTPFTTAVPSSNETTPLQSVTVWVSGLGRYHDTFWEQAPGAALTMNAAWKATMLGGEGKNATVGGVTSTTLRVKEQLFVLLPCASVAVHTIVYGVKDCGKLFPTNVPDPS